MSRGQGRVFRPVVRGVPLKTWWWDYTVRGCKCGTCDKNGRHRESSGLDYPEHTKAEASDKLHTVKVDRRSGRPIRDPAPTTLAAFVQIHLAKKRQEENPRTGEALTSQWLDAAEGHLERAEAFFGAERTLSSITEEDVAEWVSDLRTQLGLSGGSLRHHLNSLDDLFRRARHQLKGYNPARDLDNKPRARKQEAKWLEIYDGALLLEAARTYRPERSPKGGRLAVPFAYELIATYLLTGGRESEVLGLEVADVSFDAKKITFRPNEWRRLKTATSYRTVPMFPQLEAILRPYIFNTDRPPSKLLFPSYRTGKEAMLTDFRKLLDAVAERAGWEEGEIRSRMLRHTFTAAALQLLDGGAPISVYTVARWLGHGGTALVNKVYGHLGTVRHRSKVLEYRVAQHKAKLGSRLRALKEKSKVIAIGAAIKP